MGEGDCYLTALGAPHSRKWIGALYVNKPTPSGCDRFMLSISTKDRFDTPEAAVDAIARFYPAAPRHSPVDVLVDIVMPPVGSTVSVITSKRDKLVEVEIIQGGRRSACELTHDQVSTLAARKLLRLDSSSGDDDELEHVYDHYVVEKAA